MQVIHWGRARQFFQKHPHAKSPLKTWRSVVQAGDWKDFSDVKRSWNSADWVDGNIVFDISGNAFRLIAIARFMNRRVYIREVLTHEEYDKGNWKK